MVHMVINLSTLNYTIGSCVIFQMVPLFLRSLVVPIVVLSTICSIITTPMSSSGWQQHAVTSPDMTSQELGSAEVLPVLSDTTAAEHTIGLEHRKTLI